MNGQNNSINYKVKFTSTDKSQEVEAIFSSQLQACAYVVAATKAENVKMSVGWLNTGVNQWTDKHGNVFEVC